MSFFPEYHQEGRINEKVRLTSGFFIFIFVDGKDLITVINRWTLSKLNESDMTRYLV
jgi:hypothetical protein